MHCAYIKNNTGDIGDPWGSPAENGFGSSVFPSKQKLRVRSLVKDWVQSMIYCGIFLAFMSWIKHSGLVLLNAPAMSFASSVGRRPWRLPPLMFFLGTCSHLEVGCRRAKRASIAERCSTTQYCVEDIALTATAALATRFAIIFSRTFPVLERREIGRYALGAV